MDSVNSGWLRDWKFSMNPWVEERNIYSRCMSSRYLRVQDERCHRNPVHPAMVSGSHETRKEKLKTKKVVSFGSLNNRESLSKSKNMWNATVKCICFYLLHLLTLKSSAKQAKHQQPRHTTHPDQTPFIDHALNCSNMWHIQVNLALNMNQKIWVPAFICFLDMDWSNVTFT